CRVEEAFRIMNIPRAQFTYVSAPGYQLLKFLNTMEIDYIWINAGIKEFQFCLDADMVEILLSRPEPTHENKPINHVELDSDDDMHKRLGPLKEFLSRQPNVRAAWV